MTLRQTSLRRLERYRRPERGAALGAAEREVVAWVGRCARCGRTHLATRRSAVPFAPAPADTIVEEVQPGAGRAPGVWDIEIE